MKAALLALALLIPSPIQSEAPVLAEPIPKVVCDGGAEMGTAFRVGPHLLVTAKHVADLPSCQIDDEPIHVIWMSQTGDAALLSDDRAGRFIHVDCGGFVPGRSYAALGH